MLWDRFEFRIFTKCVCNPELCNCEEFFKMMQGQQVLNRDPQLFSHCSFYVFFVCIHVRKVTPVHLEAPPAPRF